jgi:hypothetical protein
MEPGKGGAAGKNKGRVETQPRFKIQYPMKNHYKDAVSYSNRCTKTEIYFVVRRTTMHKKTPF